MNEEFSAGAILFRRNSKDTKFLVIYSERNRIWGFPKGHIETGESEQDAALREIDEETGITKLRFIDGFREEDIYPAMGTRGKFRGRKITKHAIYFLCETTEEEITTDNTEITNYRWLPYSAAWELLSFASTKMLLERAHLHLKGIS